MSETNEELESPIEKDVRMKFRQGQYAEAVPFIQEHLEANGPDFPALELMATALKFSGDKPGAAGAFITAADGYAAAGHTIQSIAARKKAEALGVEPDFSAARSAAASVVSADLDAGFEMEEGDGFDVGAGMELGMEEGEGFDIGAGEDFSMEEGEGFDIGSEDDEEIEAEPSIALSPAAPEEAPAAPEAEPSLGGFEIEPEAPSLGGFEIDPEPEPEAVAELPDFSTPEAAPAEAPAEPVAPVEPVPAAPRISTPLFDSLSDAEFLEVVKQLDFKEYEPDQVIIEEDGDGDSMFVITKGRVSVSVTQGLGEAEVAQLDAGAFFGEASLLTGDPRSATIRALEPTECLELTRVAYDELAVKFPNVRTVMEAFHEERADSTVDSLLDSLDFGE